MPLYVYEPTLLTADEPFNECCFFETLQSISEPSLIACPTCGHAIHKAISSFSFSSISKPKSPPPASGQPFQSSSEETKASRASKLAMRHICGGGCSHQ